MKHTARIRPSGAEFPLSDQMTLLESALESDIHLEHSCMDGSCGTCKAKLIKGEFKAGSVKTNAGLSEEDLQEGYLLTCQAVPTSDVELEVEYFPELAGIKKSMQPCKIDDLSFPAKDTLVLKLRLSPTSQFQYVAGQYIQLIIKGERRSYSIANISDTYPGVELHIRKVENGLFSEYLFNEAKANQLLRLEGPLGSFFVRDSALPIIFLAGGTGFAPVKAMVEQLIKTKSHREIHIYWGASSRSGFYSDLPEKWEKQNRITRYVPVLSGEETWEGRTGFVHQSVLADFDDLQAFEVYACGSPLMINAAKKSFLSKGLADHNFHSDAFVSSN